jgi:hypothetical protein
MGAAAFAARRKVCSKMFALMFGQYCVLLLHHECVQLVHNWQTQCRSVTQASRHLSSTGTHACLKRHAIETNTLAPSTALHKCSSVSPHGSDDG